MKFLTALVAIIVLVTSSVFACDIFAPAVAVNGFASTTCAQAAYAPVYQQQFAAVPVPAAVYTQAVAAYAPVASPVVIQQAVPTVSTYAISSFQPTVNVRAYGASIGINSFSSFGVNRAFAVNPHGNQIVVNSVIGNRAFFGNRFGVVNRGFAFNNFGVNRAFVNNNVIAINRGFGFNRAFIGGNSLNINAVGGNFVRVRPTLLGRGTVVRAR